MIICRGPKLGLRRGDDNDERGGVLTRYVVHALTLLTGVGSHTDTRLALVDRESATTTVSNAEARLLLVLYLRALIYKVGARSRLHIDSGGVAVQAPRGSASQLPIRQQVLLSILLRQLLD